MAIKRDIEPDTKTVGDHIQGKDIELSTFNEIEVSKGQFMSNFSAYNVEDIQSQMKDLFALMESVLMGGYFSDSEVKNYKYPEDEKEKYNFFEYYSMIDLSDDKDVLREILKRGYIIYNRFKKRLKITVATDQKSGKEKLTERFFS